jgi:hypothetical protein
LVSASAGAARSQEYPTRDIHLIVGFPPGTGADVTVRYLGEKLRLAAQQTVVVENKPGANSNIATEYVGRSKPDGYTIYPFSATTVAASMNLEHDAIALPRRRSLPSPLMLPETSLVLRRSRRISPFADADRGVRHSCRHTSRVLYRPSQVDANLLVSHSAMKQSDGAVRLRDCARDLTPMRASARYPMCSSTRSLVPVGPARPRFEMRSADKS